MLCDTMPENLHAVKSVVIAAMPVFWPAAEDDNRALRKLPSHEKHRRVTSLLLLESHMTIIAYLAVGSITGNSTG